MTEIMLKEFSKLPQREQNVILFEGVNRIECRLQNIEKMITTYKRKQAYMAGWLSVLTAIGTYLGISFIQHIGGK